MLPEGVHAVKSARATYYYWHPNRGTAIAGKAIPLGKDPRDPEFWVRLRKAQGTDGSLKPGSFDALISEFKASPKWRKLRERTQDHYTHQLGRISHEWGALPVAGLTVKGIFKLRAKYEATPVAANHLVSVLRTLLGWGLSHGYGDRNPANDVEPLEIVDERNATPWPEWAYQLVLQVAPERLRRAVYLGRACGQRRSDLARYGRRHRLEDGIAVKIGKLRDKQHIIPLMAHQLLEIDSWSCSDTGPWVTAVGGGFMSGDNMQSTLNRLIAKTPRLHGLELKMHGLRAMAAIDRKLAGAENRAIAANLCMTTVTVERYIRHIDNLQLARGVRDQMEARSRLSDEAAAPKRTAGEQDCKIGFPAIVKTTG